MTIRNRLTLWLGGILGISLLLMAGVLHREWTEKQDRQDHHKAPEPPWEEVGEILLFYGIPTTLMLIGGTWLLLQKSLAPVIRLTRTAERIQVSNLNERLPLTGSDDELDRLTAVFNSMMDRIGKSFDQVRQFTLNASHELKTPLTVMRLEIETALRDPATPPAQREVFSSQLQQIDHLSRIVGSLSFLTMADAGLISAVREPVHLNDLVRDIFADAQLLARARSIRVELSACDDIVVRGDRRLLKQLLLNLIDNAIKYNEPHGFVRMGLQGNGKGAEFLISNSGPAIPPEKLPRVFDRFFRGDAAHSDEVDGSGLGLSIAQWIVHAHGGSIRLSSQPGELTTVSILLPFTSATIGELGN